MFFLPSTFFIVNETSKKSEGQYPSLFRLIYAVLFDPGVIITDVCGVPRRPAR